MIAGPTPPSAPIPPLAAFVGALPAGEFVGRRKVLDRLWRALRHHPGRAPRHLAVGGPAGAGKSELLRQGAATWAPREAELTPVYINLSSAPADGMADLFASSAAQMLFAAGRIDARELAGGVPPRQRLNELAEGTPLAAMNSKSCDLGALLAAHAALNLPRPALIIDGTADLPPQDALRWFELVSRIAAKSGSSLAFEQHPDIAALPRLDTLEYFPLAPLDTTSALDLLQATGRRRGWTLDGEAVFPVLMRLGPWPGLVRALGLQVSIDAPRHPRRIAEEAYLALLTDSAWSARLARDFEQAMPLGHRDAALRLARRTAQAGDSLPSAAVEALGDGDLADSMLHHLARLGLLQHRGQRWLPAAEQCMSDWAALQIDASSRESGLAAARTSFLARLLSAPPDPIAPGQPFPVSALIADVLGRFAAQELPDVLFEFHNYYEALGRLDPARRRQAVAASQHCLRVPEMIGVVPAGSQPAVQYAVGYHEGRYRRTSEETWIAVDLSAARALTTPEIQHAQSVAAALQQRLGAGNYTLWIIAGESASADALELLRREKILCSNLEQLVILRELLRDNAALRAAVPNPEPPAAEVPAETPPHRAVIDVQSDAPAAETSKLTLPARDDSEYIAALMAEKVAIRANFAPADAGKIKTSVLEGVLNAIEHSANPEKLIEIQFRLRPDALEIFIENEGSSFDPLAVPEPEPRRKLAAANKRGWGITLMKKFMDSVDYEPCGRGTRLRLVKRRATPRRESAEPGQQNDARI